MRKLSLNSVSPAVFKVNSSDNAGGRSDIIAMGRLLAYDHALKGKKLLTAALGKPDEADPVLTRAQYQQLNEKFQRDHLLYAAKKVCDQNGSDAPETFEEFRKNAHTYFNEATFWSVLRVMYQECIAPVLPATLSEAVGIIADVVSVGFNETYTVSVGSNAIPVFQDSAWGAQLSTPSETFYSKDFVLNPRPKVATIEFKFTQLIGSGFDFGDFFANIVAGVYAKVTGFANSCLTAAVQNPALVPAELSYTFNSQNWVKAADKVSAVTSTPLEHLIGIGSLPALSKILPDHANGSANVTVDAALSALLGRDYVNSGYLGKFMGVKLLPLRNAVEPGTQNTTVKTVLSDSTAYIISAVNKKPLIIGTLENAPVSLEFTPAETANLTMAMNITVPLDCVGVFSSKCAVITV